MEKSVLNKAIKSRTLTWGASVVVIAAVLSLWNSFAALYYINTKRITSGPILTEKSEIHVEVKKATSQRVCTSIGGSLVCRDVPKIVVQKLSVLELTISYPSRIQDQDTGEIVVIPKYQDTVKGELKSNNLVASNQVSVSFFSANFTFSPDKPLKLMPNTVEEKVLFEVKGVGNKKVIVRSELIMEPTGSERGNTRQQPGSITTLNIEVIPAPVFLGMSDKTLKGIQTLSTLIGIPGLILLIASYYVKMRERAIERKDGQKPRILFP